jgi:hypothetical protein
MPDSETQPSAMANSNKPFLFNCREKGWMVWDSKAYSINKAEKRSFKPVKQTPRGEKGC